MFGRSGDCKMFRQNRFDPFGVEKKAVDRFPRFHQGLFTFGPSGATAGPVWGWCGSLAISP